MKNKSNKKEKYFSAAEKGSFAEFTVEKRFKKIFEDYCSGNYEKFIETPMLEIFFDDKVFSSNEKEKSIDAIAITIEHFNEIKNDDEISNKEKYKFFLDIVNAFLNSFEKKLEDETIYGIDEKCEVFQNKLKLKDCIYNAPFFEAEVLFYHALLAQKEYFSNKNDFFASGKKFSIINGNEDFIHHLKSLFSNKDREKEFGKDDEKKYFKKSLLYCLSANTSDLSQLNSKDRFDFKTNDITVLCDDSESVYEFLKTLGTEKDKHKRFDIICDNCGKELFSDLFLACYFLYLGLADEVVFHVKKYPFFVSDATENDFGFLLQSILTKDKDIEECRDYLNSGKIKVETNDFWTSPKTFNELEKDSDLYKELTKSSLIIVKGDLNYRRLVEDKNWNYDESFIKLTENVFGNVPILAPRVIKSDVLVGVSSAMYHLAKSTESVNSSIENSFKANGKWAVIHFNPKKKLKEKILSFFKKKNNDNSDENVSKDKKNVSEQKKKKKEKTVEEKIYSKGAITVISLISALLLISFIFCAASPIFSAINFIANKVYDTKNLVYISSFAFDGKSSVDFAFLLAGYALFFAGTILVPKFLLKEKVSEEVKIQLDERLKTEIKTSCKNEIDELIGNSKRHAADWARMTAFFLTGKELYIWSTGWCFHSVKRYLDYSQMKASKEICDFLSFIRNTILKKNMASFFEPDELDFKKYLKTEADKYKETDITRPALRALKDIADVEFFMQTNSLCSKVDSEIQTVANSVSFYAGSFARYLTVSFLKYFAKERNEMDLSEEENLFKELIKISRYCNEEEYSEQYKKFLKAVIAEIKMHGVSSKGNFKKDDEFKICKEIYSKEDLNGKEKDFKNERFYIEPNSEFKLE
ncbi:damage-control phosphatase ARMT1 family protein [uncultured Treponema sp.]|uniref:damage-control phosphatase ARMT1 family protein n=1 Tax=uncultured Treponema sp. TaxID=162155 RepID=UPI0028048063|nr:damage-control phosphatase ARMT1 family protein [uncultured Treponema sp.]